MLNVPEIILIIVIVVIVFGVGKLPKVGARLGKAGKQFKDGLEGEADDAEAIDITPEHDRQTERGAYDPKPGTRPQPVDDVEIDEPERNEA